MSTNTSSILDNVDIDLVLQVLGEQVVKVTGKELTKAEKIVIKGAWEDKDYNEIARVSGYSMYYLQQKIGPPLWTMLTTIVGNGVKVKKSNLKDILLKVAKKDYLRRLEVLPDNNYLVGKTKIHGELPKIEYFYGREEEINYLKNQIKLFKQRCISITGVGGIGKSLFIVKIVEEILFENSELYDYVIWKKVERSSTIDEIVTELLKTFNIEVELNRKCLKTKLSLLSKQLSSSKYLLIIDGFENLAQIGIGSVERKIEFDDFFDAITKEQYLSCTIITSQISLKEFFYTTINLPILHLKLEGLEISAAIKMLHKKGLKGEECKDLIETYRGNPSELEAVADRINRIFGGSLEKFFDYKTTVVGPRIEAMLNRQFGQDGLLTNLQREIMIYLAEEITKVSAPISFSKLIDDLRERLNLKMVSVSQVITSLEILEQRSLVETSKKSSKEELHYGIEPVVKKYILVDLYGLVYNKKLASYVQEQNSP